MNLRIAIPILLFILMAGLIVGCSNSEITGAAVRDLNKLSVRLPIPTNDAGFAPFFTAVDKGFFKDEGLEVTFNFGSAEANPIKMVITGQDDIGFIGGPDTLLVAKSKGHPIKAFALYHRYSDFPVLITNKDSGITNVKQLEGKKVGFYYGHISTDVLRNLFRKEKVNIEEIDVGFSLNQLLAKKVDAQWWFRIPGEVVLPAKNIDVNIIHPKDYGIRTHGFTFFATEETLEKKADLLKSFMRAVIKASEYTNNNPEEAIQSVLSREQTLSYDIELEKLKRYNKVVVNPSNLSIGYIDEEILKGTYDRLEEEGVLKNSFDLKEAFTTKILEQIGKQ